jgi:hypothetical protein
MTIDKTALESKPEAAIQQINLSYSAEQDRLLLRVLAWRIIPNFWFG